jgi:ABC-type multidrug transport system permease subunit
VLLVGIALNLLLILYGIWITPGVHSLTTENIARMASAFTILGIYALVAILAPEGMNRRSSLILSNGLRFGCLAGVVFAGEICAQLQKHEGKMSWQPRFKMS